VNIFAQKYLLHDFMNIILLIFYLFNTHLIYSKLLYSPLSKSTQATKEECMIRHLFTYEFSA